MKVRIKTLPKAAYGGQQSDGALDVTPTRLGGNSSESRPVKKTLSSVPRRFANLEAEGGETAFGPISGDTIPDHMVIKGPRHSNGGVPLNLPEDTFIFSDTKSMRITDPKILKMFGKKRKKGGYTPAELAKPYDIQKYKAILMDPDSDRKDKENAELMIKNFIMKLGALAIAQESKKGFPQGIPEMARPYMEANGITEEDLIPEQEQEQSEMPEDEMAEGGTPEYPHGGFHTPFEESMQKAKEVDFTALSAPDLEGPQGQFTEDETLGNIYGEEPALRRNTEGELYENQKQEGTQGQDISFEVGVKNAYDVDGNMLADQGAFFAGIGSDIGERVKTSKKMKSIFDKSMDKPFREDAIYGLHYANTPGVISTSAVSPTSVQYKLSQYGGELDKFVYGGDDPVTPNQFDNFQPMDEVNTFDNPAPAGTRDFTTHFGNASRPIMREQPTYDPSTDPKLTKHYMTNKQGEITGQTYVPAGKTYNSRALNRKFQKGKIDGEAFYDSEYAYGGTPMSLYGIDMGGSYFPIMSTGGARRVKITGLPRKDDGGPKVSRKDAKLASSQAEYDALTGNGWREYTDANGKKWKVKYIEGEEVAGSKVEAEVFNDRLTSTTQLNKDLCARMAKGEGEKNSLANYSAADVIAKFYPAVAKNPDSQEYKNLEGQLVGCENMVGGKKTDDIIDSRKFDPNDNCECEILDSEGNPTGEYEYYKGTINEETGKLECPPCDYEEIITSEEQLMDEPMPPPIPSDRAIGNLLTQFRFKTNAARKDPQLVDDPTFIPSLQRRYDSDIQSNLAGFRRSSDFSGGTAQQKLFRNLAAMQQANAEVGKRQKQTEDYNTNVLNRAAQIAANLQSGTDARNQQEISRTRTFNAQAQNNETAARNAALMAQNLAKTDMREEMRDIATYNFNNPNFPIDYKTGLPYRRITYQDPNPTRGQKDIVSEYQRILGDIGDSDKNKEIAFNLANKSVYGKYGGYISGADTYPFFNE